MRRIVPLLIVFAVAPRLFATSACSESTTRELVSGACVVAIASALSPTILKISTVLYGSAPESQLDLERLAHHECFDIHAGDVFLIGMHCDAKARDTYDVILRPIAKADEDFDFLAHRHFVTQGEIARAVRAWRDRPGSTREFRSWIATADSLDAVTAELARTLEVVTDEFDILEEVAPATMRSAIDGPLSQLVTDFSKLPPDASLYTMQDTANISLDTGLMRTIDQVIIREKERRGYYKK